MPAAAALRVAVPVFAALTGAALTGAASTGAALTGAVLAGAALRVAVPVSAALTVARLAAAALLDASSAAAISTDSVGTWARLMASARDSGRTRRSSRWASAREIVRASSQPVTLQDARSKSSRRSVSTGAAARGGACSMTPSR
ncbi:hypothetical protein GCM10010435_66690 [Winogradskya consettensis]|uniref:Uncharacterized protein n=1 Tax=Winogradskya consettensis TaxID=113560 RepID=A0A919SLZ6_9ACTN|nr:hypothetical protein Aco04nite_38070 [Actinoplanes consettensis]